MSYHSNGELAARIDDFLRSAGSRVSVEIIGSTVAGKPIPALTVAPKGSAPEPSRPQVLITANIHGNEVIGSEVALRLVELLLASGSGSRAAELLQMADVTVVPAVNLDSRASTMEGLASALPFGRAPRGNGHGVDLNRNFPYPRKAQDVWHPLSGTTVRWLPWYRGPEALSEPEARALAELGERLRPVAALGLHSVGRYVLYPYCYTPDPPAAVEDFLAMGDAFVAAQRGSRYRVRQSRSWYAILGDLDDWLYDSFGTLAVTVELSTPLAGVARNPLRLGRPFSWMNPASPEGTVRNTEEACLAALIEGCRRRGGA